jgi:hypothetical protein
VYAYVLISNHVHLLIETGAVGLSTITQGIQFSYIQRRVVAEHLHGDASMLSRFHAAYVEKRDKRSESDLQRWLKTKSTIHA